MMVEVVAQGLGHRPSRKYRLHYSRLPFGAGVQLVLGISRQMEAPCRLAQSHNSRERPS